MQPISGIRPSARQNYDIFYLYYFRNDHDPFYQFHGAQVFLELICRKVHTQKITFRTHFGYCEFLTVSFWAITLNSLYRYDEPGTLLASPIERRVLATWAQPGVGFAAPSRLAFNVVLRADFSTWAPPSTSLAELCRTPVFSAWCCVTQWPYLGLALLVASSISV